MTIAHGRTRVSLELEEQTDPIRGSLDLGDGTRRAFCGWLELAGLLDKARGSATDASGFRTAGVDIDEAKEIEPA